MTDSHVVVHWGKKLKQSLESFGIEAELIPFPAGEIYKNRETKQSLEDILFQKKYGRDTCLIALGGGVVTDLVGFLAATYCRGIPVIYVPTTLLAMVDACIGGKTGINTPFGKNLIGTFTQPAAVFIDPATLNSLPDNEFNNGVVEMIKHGIVADSTLFSNLQEEWLKIKNKEPHFLIEMIYTNCLIKKKIVELDEKEQGLRQLLNFGHTIGHAIEVLEDYQVSHGEAVAIGMLVESYLSMLSGYLKNTAFELLKSCLYRYGLPLKTKAFQNIAEFKQALILDKKTINNKARFVLLENIGKPYCADNYATPVNPDLLDQALRWAAENFIG